MNNTTTLLANTTLDKTSTSITTSSTTTSSISSTVASTITNNNMVFSLIMIFAPVVGYIPQYRSIEKTGNCEGFSTKVSLILLLANITRCFFWIGKRFESTLLYQSLVMIVAQLAMLNLCVTIKSKDNITNSRSKRVSINSFFEHEFWEWDNIFPYLLFLGGYTFFFLMLTYLFLFVESFFELLGSLSLTIEAILGVPQLIQNYKKKSTKGLSYALIGSWFAGDLFKTFYFIYNSSPMQFILCGVFQITVDALITYQMMVYRN